ncbi:MAG TPA: hypothetical protein VG754_03150, partial [Verrucomicrobiae bacterium]|nr:hypothetical protein [Verrucomicrobiae bacterium]
FLAFAVSTALAVNSPAQDTPSKSTNAPVATRSGKQADLASTTAKFGSVAKTDDAYKSAIDAHALDDALKLAGKESAFKGMVTKIFEPRNVALINFDADYHSAITAVVQGTNFSKFPALTNLVGKNVLVTGTFTNYQGRPEIVLTNAQQIKLAE